MCLLFFCKHQGCLAHCVNVKVLISCNGSQARTSHNTGNTTAATQRSRCWFLNGPSTTSKEWDGQCSIAGTNLSLNHQQEQEQVCGADGMGWGLSRRYPFPPTCWMPGCQGRAFPGSHALVHACKQGKRRAWTREAYVSLACSLATEFVISIFAINTSPLFSRVAPTS